MVLGAIVFWVGCADVGGDAPEVVPAFYYWRGRFDIGVQEERALKHLNVRKLYVKFFDVDVGRDGEAVPLAVLQVAERVPDSIEVVPVVFITNRTLRGLGDAEVERLARRIAVKVDERWGEISTGEMQELQLDCDWTERTRGQYFALIRYLRKAIPERNCKLSATIRLHQLKYAQRTGVPPVARGMLMFYNVGDVEDYGVDNSILDLAEAEKYLDESTGYALPLDVALPIFRWGVLYRNGRMIKLINNLSMEDLGDSSRFEPLSENRYEVLKSTYLNAYYLYRYDVIRLEAISARQLQQAAEMLKPFLRKQDTTTLSLYHLSPATLNHYEHESLQAVFQSFSE